jgi:hypothetical protein
MIAFAIGILVLVLGTCAKQLFPQISILNESANIFATSAAGFLIDVIRVNFKKIIYLPKLLWLWVTQKRLRLTISYLIRIKGSQKYMLVYSNKTHVWGPVGGVYKFTTSNGRNKFGLEDDNGFPDSPQDDMRVSLPSKRVFSLYRFIKWFDSQKEREFGPHREFQEELFSTNILDIRSFGMPIFEFVRTERYFNYSHHFQTDEFRIFDIFCLAPTPSQVKILESLERLDSPNYKFLSSDEITRRYAAKDNSKVGDQASYIL